MRYLTNNSQDTVSKFCPDSIPVGDFDGCMKYYKNIYVDC